MFRLYFVLIMSKTDFRFYMDAKTVKYLKVLHGCVHVSSLSQSRSHTSSSPGVLVGGGHGGPLGLLLPLEHVVQGQRPHLVPGLH